MAVVPRREAGPLGALEQAVVQRQGKGAGRTSWSTVLALEDMAALAFDQQEPQLQMAVPVMVEESFEGKLDVVERKTEVRRTGVYFACWFEQPEQQPRMTRPGSNKDVNTERWMKPMEITYWMALVFELVFSHSGRVSFVTQNVVMVVLLVVDCIDDLVEALGSNRWAVLQRADGQSLSKQQFLVECCWR